MRTSKKKKKVSGLTQRVLSPEEKKWLASAKHKYFLPTLMALNNLATPKSLKVSLITQNRKTNKEEKCSYSVKLKQSLKEGLTFEITNQKYFDVSGIHHKESYGLTKHLVLSNKNGDLRYVKPNSIKNFITTFPKGKQKLKGKFSSFGTADFNSNQKWYFRLLIPISDYKKNIQYPFEYIQGGEFLKFDQKLWNAQMSALGIRFLSMKGTFTQVHIQEQQYDFYVVEDIPGQIIDSNAKIDLATFKKYTHAIRSAFAVLSGKYYRDQIFYIASNRKDFKKITQVFFEHEEESVLTDNKLINFQLAREMFDSQDEVYRNENKNKAMSLSSSIFSRLCSEIFECQPINRTIELIISGNRNINPLQKGAIYSVAIETLTGEIYERNSVKLKPLKDKVLWKELRGKLLQALDSMESRIDFTAIKVFKARIENMNQPPNREKLSMPFDYYGIQISDDERKVLEYRNKFLHGDTPHTDIYDLEEIALQLHHLIGCLLLKHVGYSGYVTNLAIFRFIKDSEKMDQYIREGLTTRVKTEVEIEQLIAEGKLEEAKAALGHKISFLKRVKEMNQKLDLFMRII